jgi:hypothetical protein
MSSYFIMKKDLAKEQDLAKEFRRKIYAVWNIFQKERSLQLCGNNF